MRLLARVPERWRDRLDNWRFWITSFGFVLALLIVALFFVNQRTTKTLVKQAQAQQMQEQRLQTAAEAGYQQCVGSIPQLRRISTHLQGVNELAATLLRNSRANLAATPAGDPQLAVRTANLARLAEAEAKIAAVDRLPVPTVADCKARRQAALDR